MNHFSMGLKLHIDQKVIFSESQGQVHSSQYDYVFVCMFIFVSVMYVSMYVCIRVIRVVL